MDAFNRPAQLDAGGVTRVTNLTPSEQKRLEELVEQEPRGKRYQS